MLGTRRPRDLQNAVKPTLADAAGSGGEVASALWPWSSDGSFARCMVGYGVAATGDVRRCKHGMLRKQSLVEGFRLAKRRVASSATARHGDCSAVAKAVRCVAGLRGLRMSTERAWACREPRPLRRRKRTPQQATEIIMEKQTCPNRPDCDDIALV